MATLRLGSRDAGAPAVDKKVYFDLFHEVLSQDLKLRRKFRDEANNVWRDFQDIPGTNVADLQQFLHEAGFLAAITEPGFYGYVTGAAVRLFQEYIRSVEGDASIGTPDGVAGPNTLKHVERWKTAGLKSEYASFSATNPSMEYQVWMNMLKNAKAHFIANASPVLQLREVFAAPTDTLRLTDWNTDPNEIHLIGIRRNQDQQVGADEIRENDDLFVLLFNGMVFKFWGSTDANPHLAHKDRKDEAYLMEGQHRYSFGWHKISDGGRVYRALRPSGPGVLVFRDRDGANALTEENISKGIDAKANQEINIHWSGKGDSNFSAGCQVIAGQSYINHRGELVDCSGFAASTYQELTTKTRGAYNFMADLALALSGAGVNKVYYTLGRDETLDLEPTLGAAFAEKAVRRMKGLDVG
ncbi:MAG TPA: peptidoglycan-binding domain-containing protein [Flavilitoribacter sp.]|nr:peptidoglycan-binding domain-containing protein [Flavilitoribacter sp.]HMQ87859.1 peptidoglycan-binding domain-containing protein [Flavilitoribacter sp.]